MPMKFIKGLYSVVDKLCYILIALGFGGIVTVLGLQMILRIVGTPFMWAEEVARYLFLWTLFICGARAFSRGGHLAVDFVFAKFPKKIQLVLMFIYYIAIIGFSIYLLRSGIIFAKFQWKTPMYTLPWVRLGWVDLCIPIGSGLTIFYVLRELFYMIKRGPEYMDRKGGALG